MKAKLYVFENKLELVFEDGTYFAPTKSETKDEFVERVSTIAKDEFLDDEFEVVEITEAEVAENDDQTLQEAMIDAQGLKKKLVQAELVKRNLLKDRTPKPKVAPRTAEDMKASDEYKEALALVGKHANFSPFKSEDVHTGKIAGVALNKTNTIIYLTIVEESGKRRCCALKNESLEIIDAPIVVEKEVAKPKAKAKAKGKAKTDSVETATDAAGDTPAADGDDLM